MNDENLIPLNKRSPRERKEICRKGAEATNKKLREQKTMRQLMEIMLKTPETEKNIAILEKMGIDKKDANIKAGIVYAGIIQQAKAGDKWAIEQIIKLFGEYEATKIQLSGSIDTNLKAKEIEKYLDARKNK
ncbi:MAG: helix-turn-helix domain-containing protein [Bacteroidales bacterium]|nr:helix-turn-helix domain-containing protein [Bacteroidales bacterium]